ncbi:O-antigen ligase family protein [Litorimonas sp. RW-G-Af-16]|uniref:O-antigen ligase family protein n=1 Tax=Litorimonas sp. RW-G-Af-16 TaxID=3241168 RepID=UPI00390CC1B2
MSRAAKLFALAVLWFSVLTMPPLAHAGGLGIVISGALLGLGGLAITLSSRPEKRISPPLWVWLFLAFLVWINLTALWSPYAADGVTNAHKIAATGVLLLFVPQILTHVSADLRALLRRVIITISVIAVAVMLVDVVSGWRISLMFDPVSPGESIHAQRSDALQNVGHGIFTYGQYVPPLIMLILCTMNRPWSWLAATSMIALTALAGVFNMLDIAPLMILISLAVMGLAYIWPKTIVSISLLTFAGLILAAPLFGIVSQQVLKMDGLTLPASWDHRFHMWAYCWEQIQTAPLWGHGFDASRAMQDTYLAKTGQEMALLSLHPHNAGLQIWLETGLVGVLLFCSTVLALWRPAHRYVSTKPRAAALCGWLAATAIIGATTLGVWQFWWWGVVGYGLVLLQLVPAKSRDTYQSGET